MRETISSTLTALADGKIKPEEMPVPDDTRKDFIRYAPGFGRGPVPGHVPYTIEALAKFLGEIDQHNEPRHQFRDTFNSLELISEGF